MSDHNVLYYIISKSVDQVPLKHTPLFYALIAVLLSSIFLAMQQQLQNHRSYHTEAWIRLIMWTSLICSVVQ